MFSRCLCLSLSVWRRDCGQVHEARGIRGEACNASLSCHWWKINFRRLVSMKFEAVFYPRDAMVARVLAIWPGVCLSVSITSRCSIELTGRIELAFGTEASFDLSYSVL